MRGELTLAEVVEHGVLFRTGEPVTFCYLRNTAKAFNFGAKFQQDIEPAGRYMLHNPAPGALAPGWEAGEATFRSPLVIPLMAKGVFYYGPGSWKDALHRHYKRRGKALSRAIVKDGYDGVVTVTFHKGKPVDTREIVDLTWLRSTPSKALRALPHHSALRPPARSPRPTGWSRSR